MKESPEFPIAVIGAGVAGSAIACELAKNGRKVLLLARAKDEGSSFTNQKWHHSGLLYVSGDYFKTAWSAFQADRENFSKYVVQKRPAWFIALEKHTLDNRLRNWGEWAVPAGIEWRQLTDEDCLQVQNQLGRAPVGGFEVPDEVIDFPRLIHDLRRRVCELGGEVREQAYVTDIVENGGRVNAIRVTEGGESVEIPITHCVVAAGAWSVSLLQSPSLCTVTLPEMRLRLCPVLVFEKELVEGITTCLDANGSKERTKAQDVTLVPFKGQTIAAGTRFKLIENPDKALQKDTNEEDFLEEERDDLLNGLAGSFPNLRGMQFKRHGCIKTEFAPKPGYGGTNLHFQVCGRDRLGVESLTLAIPGKASFLFQMARNVVAMCP